MRGCLIHVNHRRKDVFLGECKFRNAGTDVSDLDRLREKASFVKQGAVVQYALFSKSGFAKKLAEQAQGDTSVRLFPLSEIVNGQTKN